MGSANQNGANESPAAARINLAPTATAARDAYGPAAATSLICSPAPISATYSATTHNLPLTATIRLECASVCLLTPAVKPSALVLIKPLILITTFESQLD